MDDIVLARVLHVLAIVLWIGGVSMATTVALPAVRHGDFGPDRLRVFEAFEGRFVWQARAAVILAGLTGFYMVERLDLWSRFTDIQFWWMHAMVCVWTLFALLLFVGEPFILHRIFPRWAARNPEQAFKALHRLHVVLLALSYLTIFGAVAGSHGWLLL